MKCLSIHHLILAVVLLGSIFLTAQAILKPGLMLGHDAYAHATYSKLFINGLNEGQFPVRWIEHVWVGFGQPLFNYYQVGFFYFIWIVNLLPISFLWSIKIGVLVLWWIGGIFVYLLTKKWGRLSGILATVVYIFSPYLILDIFIRNSYPEFMAVSLIPGVLWSIEKLFEKPRVLTLSILAVFLSLIIISHLPTLVIFTPILGGFSLLKFQKSKNKIKSLGFALISGVLAIGISAFYLIPAITELDSIQIQKMHSGVFSFSQNFVNPLYLPTYLWGYGGEWWGENFYRARFIGLIQWTIIFCTFSFILIQIIKRNIRSLNIEMFFWLGAILYSFFFMQRMSDILWSNINTLAYIQFPWRFFMVIPVSTAVLSALILSNIKKLQIKYVILMGVFLSNFILVAPFMAPKAIIAGEYFNLSFSDWKKNEEVKKVAFSEPGYSPIASNDIQKGSVNKIINSSRDSQINGPSIKNHHISFGIKAQNPEQLTINTPYYPGWKAYLNDRQMGIEPNENGFISVSIPAGNNYLEFRMLGTRIAVISNYISLFSALFLIEMLTYVLIMRYILNIKLKGLIRFANPFINLAK